MSTRRKSLIEALNAAGRATSAAAIMFHTVVSAKIGLTATEEKTLDILQRRGPITAGTLAEETKLAPATVTSLIDKLERKRFVQRVAHPMDKRSILIETRPEAMNKLMRLFDTFAQSIGDLYERYTDDELATILDFLNRAAARQRSATTALLETKRRGSQR